jgi:hypothetical protein
MHERLLITTAIGLMLGTGAFAQSSSEQPKTNLTFRGAKSDQLEFFVGPSSQSSTRPLRLPSRRLPRRRNRKRASRRRIARGTMILRARKPSQTSHPPRRGRNPIATRQRRPRRRNLSSDRVRPIRRRAILLRPPTIKRSRRPPGTDVNTNAGAQPSTNTAAQLSNNQTNTAQSRASNVNISANLNESQRTRISESLTRLNTRPVTKANFSLSVGTVVPRDVQFQPLPADVVEVMPQYRGYNSSSAAIS